MIFVFRFNQINLFFADLFNLISIFTLLFFSYLQSLGNFSVIFCVSYDLLSKEFDVLGSFLICAITFVDKQLVILLILAVDGLSDKVKT